MMNSNQFLDSPNAGFLVILMVFFVCVSCTMDDSDRTVAKENSNKQAVPDNPQNQTLGEQTAQSMPADKQMRVFLDPETGEMRAPTETEAKALGNADTEHDLKTTGEPQSVGQPVVQPDGTVKLKLEDRHMKHKIVTVCEDGSLATNCQSRE